MILKVDPHVRTLLDFRYRPINKAKRGSHGRGKNQRGKDAFPLILRVPPGTVVKDEAREEVLADLTLPGQLFVVARGGKGGKGNVHFVKPWHQAPRYAEDGQPGEERWIVLELKLIADVGLVGLPNAGKSTLLSRVSAANPKVADYPFTTLTPYLGVVKLSNYRSFVMADIPGIIERAHQGAGLGLEFLRHVERTRVLLHLVDLSGHEGDPWDAFQVVSRELAAYGSGLDEKPRLVVGTKLDLVKDRGEVEAWDEKLEAMGLPFYAISAATGEGLGGLLEKVWHLVGEEGKGVPMSLGDEA